MINKGDEDDEVYAGAIHEAVRLVESGESIAAAARSLGVVEQTLFNWVKAQREGRLKDVALHLDARQLGSQTADLHLLDRNHR